MSDAAILTAAAPPPHPRESSLTSAEWGMAALLVSEASFFATLVVAYVAFLGQDTSGPTPREVLSLPWAVGMTACLAISSFTAHAAHRAAEHDRAARFYGLWAATIALGAAFLAATALEWRELFVEHRLTLSRNLFGTTYYTLVGFHALHVVAGVVMMSLVLALAAASATVFRYRGAVQLVSWYWHLVDGVWLVVFLVVYVAGRTS